MNVVDVEPDLRLALPQYPVRVRLPRAMDDEALFEFCALNRKVRIERAADGELWITAPTGGDTGWRNSELNFQLARWARADGTGRTFGSSTGFILPNGAVRSPDASWVRADRWDALPAASRRRFPALCPDFVVELASPSDDLGMTQSKMREYVENGARLAWLVDPQTRVAWVYHPGGAVERHDAPSTLRADPVLEGFVLDLSTIW